MRIEALINRILKEMLRDKRHVSPDVYRAFIYHDVDLFSFQSNTDTKADLAVHGVDSAPTKAIDTKHVRLHQVNNDQPIALIKAHDYAGVLTQDGDKLTLTLANADQGKSAILKQTLQAASIKLKCKPQPQRLRSKQPPYKSLRQPSNRPRAAQPRFQNPISQKHRVTS